MGYYDYGKPTIETWVHDPKVPKGTTKANLAYIREIRGLIDDFSKNNMALYFLTVKLNVNSMTRLMLSGKKQRGLLLSWNDKLLVKAVPKNYHQAFDTNIAGLHERVRYVKQIIEANLKLTEYYPFFCQGGFDELYEMRGSCYEDDKALMEAVEEYQKTHAEEIEKHMEKVSAEKETHEAYQKQMRDRKKAEKDLAKLTEKRAKKERGELNKEIIAFNRKDTAAEKGLEYLYKEADRYWGRHR